jgi:hypothetical protein
MTIETVLSPLERLEIREACQRLALDYSFLADAGRMEEWSRLFAEDGEMHMFGTVHKGPGAILAAVSTGDAASRLTVHAITNHRIDVLGEDEAAGSVYILVFAGERKGDGPVAIPQITPLMVGTYEDHYRRTPTGWKFARRAFSPLIASSPP